jgi:hypothetical protein
VNEDGSDTGAVHEWRYNHLRVNWIAQSNAEDRAKGMR